MALVDKNKVHRRAIPHEEGEWMDFRAVPWEDWPETTQGKQATKAMLVACIAAWSYTEPVTEQTVGLLDPGTMAWASAEIVKLNGGSDLANLAARSNGSTLATNRTPASS
ncbi:MAG: hypothetical protein NUW01_07115 [Gemmatimonadaceae bacterium]|nr:hypothetical protein [Gemmatimonadaceae bacterium]